MIITIIIFVAILSLLIFVHEFGHFWTARRFSVRVDEFGFGLPPRILGLQKIGKKLKVTFGNRPIEDTEPTIYSLNWIPIGGFVRIKGENGGLAEQKDSFPSKKIWQRIIIISAGVIMNVILCIVLLSIGYAVGMPGLAEGQSKYAKISDPALQVVEIVPDSPAQKAGIAIGDKIMEVNGERIESLESLQSSLSDKENQNVEIAVRRNNKNISLQVVPAEINDRTGIGVALVNVAKVRFPLIIAIWQGIKTTFIWIWLIVSALAMIIKNLIIQKPLGVDLSGPIGIAVMTGQAASLGWVYLLQFAALLSINLAIINILPFPALDGGRILFLIVEKFRGRAMKQKWENLANNIGFLLLLALIIAVSFRDVLIYGDRILSVFKGILGA